jgi:hypothetical protein
MFASTSGRFVALTPNHVARVAAYPSTLVEGIERAAGDLAEGAREEIGLRATGVVARDRGGLTCWWCGEANAISDEIAKEPILRAVNARYRGTFVSPGRVYGSSYTSTNATPVLSPLPETVAV